MSRIDDLLKQMTIEEKLAMLAGADLWHSVGIPRLGIEVLAPLTFLAFETTRAPTGARRGPRSTAM